VGGEAVSSHNWHDGAAEIREEALAACLRYPPFRSAHEGFAVLKEEVDELWEEVKAKEQNIGRMREEAKQVGAMALRFMLEVCGPRGADAVKADLYARDASRLRNLAQAVIFQVDAFRRNSEGGDDDTMRFLIIAIQVQKMSNIANRAERRWRSEYEARRQ